LNRISADLAQDLSPEIIATEPNPQSMGALMATVLVTGASRGIGLELVQQYAEDGWHVVAAARRPQQSADLVALAKQFGAKLELKTLDLTSADSIKNLTTDLKAGAIDLLVNNAAIYPRKGTHIGELDYEAWGATLETNLFGVLRLTEALLENVARSERKQIVAISSAMASLHGVAGRSVEQSGTSYQYRTSKAALNMTMLILAKELAPRGISVVMISPGWVKTDMGGTSAAITPQVSVAGIKKVLDAGRMDISGKFLSYEGTVIPW
jgi:NAD(P)-dependent dehydrogenase (short-subunit alcohol dehydrogenase family)